MKRAVSVTLALCAAPAFAQPTTQELRDLARAGDVDGLEAVFATAFGDFSDDVVAASDLRDMVTALTVTDPTIRDTIEDWHATLPDSPFATTVAASLLSRDSVSLRGDRYVAYTNPNAMAAFHAL